MSTAKLLLRHTFVGDAKFNIAASGPRLFLLIVSMIGSQILMTGTASSTSVSATLFNTVSHAIDQTGALPQSAVALPDQNSNNTVGSAQANISLGPTGGVSASAGGSVFVNPITLGLEPVNASAHAELDFHLIVTGPNSSTLVPIDIFTVIKTAVNGSGTATAFIDVNGTRQSGFDGTGFNGEIQLSLTAGTYLVTLDAAAAGFGSGGSGTASADPFFFIDPTFDLTGYSLSLDGGVQNGIPPDFVGPGTATPLPAALPLFATGVGGIGVLSWRRKRRARSAAI